MRMDGSGLEGRLGATTFCLLRYVGLPLILERSTADVNALMLGKERSSAI